MVPTKDMAPTDQTEAIEGTGPMAATVKTEATDRSGAKAPTDATVSITDLTAAATAPTEVK